MFKFINIMSLIHAITRIYTLISIYAPIIIISNYCDLMRTICYCYHHDITIINTRCYLA